MSFESLQKIVKPHQLIEELLSNGWNRDYRDAGLLFHVAGK